MFHLDFQNNQQHSNNKENEATQMSSSVEPGRGMTEAKENELHANNMQLEDRLLPETTNEEAEDMTKCKLNSDLDKTQDRR